MKILNVRIKNINSLAGEHEIDFDKPPLNEVGIFAITGPNGSGKSSILDAICLALYGQTPRFKTQSEQVLNKRSSDCYAEVAFSLNHSRYRSRSSARRSNGAVHTRMRLFEQNGGESLLKETVNSVREEIGRLTGLDFKRFSRSVMLPQGEFAAFLHALSSERIEVIDKIAGKEAYQDHCETVLKAADVEAERLIAQQEVLAQLPRPEKDAALEEALETAEKAYLATAAERDGLRREQDLILRCENEREAYRENQIALGAALARREAMKDDIHRLARARAAAAFAADLKDYDMHAAAAAEEESRFAALGEAVEKTKKDLAELSERARTARTALGEAEQEQARGAETLEAAIAAYREVRAAEEAFREQVDRYEALEREQKENLQAQARVKDDMARNESERAATEKWLEKHAPLERLTEAIPRVREIVSRLTSVREKIDGQDDRRRESLEKVESARAYLEKAREAHARSLEKVEALKSRKAGQEETADAILADISPGDFEAGVHQNIRRLKNRKKLVKAAKGYRKQIAGNGGSVETALRETEEELAVLDQTFETRQTAMVNFEKKIKFDTERSQLTPGAPCPLCGALDHPYTADAEDAGNARKMLKGMKKELKKILKTRKGILGRIKDLQKRLERIGVYEVEWENLCRDAGDELPIGDVEAAKQALRDVRQEGRSGKKALRVVKRREGKSKRMAEAVESASENLRERQALLREKEGEVALHRKLLAALEQSSVDMAAEESALLASLRDTVAEFDERMPELRAEDGFLLKITARLEEYRARQTRLPALAGEARDLLAEAERLPEALKALKSEAEALEGRIAEQQRHAGALKKEFEARFGAEDPVLKKQATAERIRTWTAEQERILAETETAAGGLAEAEQALEEARGAHDRVRTARDTLERILKNKVIAATVFRDLDDVRGSFIPDAEKEILEAHVAQVEEEIREYRKTQEKLKISSAATPPVRSLAEVELAADDAEKRLGLLKDDLDRLTERAAEAGRAEALYRTERNRLESLRKRCDHLNALKLAIESGDDARVRRGFQEEMFRKLLEKTGGSVGVLNEHRYPVCPSGTDPFGLQVEVARDGEITRRPVEGLSGGETFLISLAMALALSDLTDGDRRIQSLFIDEGFGYLDDENLTQVLNTLNEHLKANGKRVGVISHVSRLDEEFQTKIQVIPERGGKTRLEVLPKELPTPAG